MVAMSGIHIVYQYFRVQSSETLSEQDALRRQREYDECLYKNLKHKNVMGVHLLLENENDQAWLRKTIQRLRSWLGEDKSKLTANLLGRRLLYSDAFSYCNNQLAGSIAVIMNADIYIGQGVDDLLRLQESDSVFWNKHTVYSLTRHEHKICTRLTSPDDEQAVACECPFIPKEDSTYYAGSHDSFWFVPPIALHFVKCVRHVQNRWGAEHLVIKELLAHGYKVLNPSKTILTFHNHASALRPWRQQEVDAEKPLADPRDHLPLYPICLKESYPWWPVSTNEESKNE